MRPGEKQQVVPKPPGPVVAFAPAYREALGTLRRRAAEQIQQHRVPGMEGGLRRRPGRRIGALHAEPHLDPEIGRAPAAPKAERQGLGQALQLHHGVAVQEARAGSQIEKVARRTAETVWCMPEKTPFDIDERMSIIGTEGFIHIQDTFPNIGICTKDGFRSPDTTYWPELHGRLSGALREEFLYFTRCVQDGTPPTIITPQESMEAVRTTLAAERSAATGEVVRLD